MNIHLKGTKPNTDHFIFRKIYSIFVFIYAYCIQIPIELQEAQKLALSLSFSFGLLNGICHFDKYINKFIYVNHESGLVFYDSLLYPK